MDNYSWELSLITKPRDAAGEILKNIYAGLDIDKYCLVEKQDEQCLRVSAYINADKKARCLCRKLRNLKLSGVRFESKRINQKDCLEVFKKDIRPFAITKSFDVVPSHLISEYRPTASDPIILDVNMAFGTGLHETTRFMAELIEQCQGRFLSFLDVGTGTGILSIIAFKCGARRVQAVDISPTCIQAAKRNLRYNQLKFDSCQAVDFRGYRIRRGFDFVAANLLTEDIISFKKKLVACVRAGQYLALSGIALDNFNKIKTALKELPLSCQCVKRGEKWAAVLYKKLT